jgi:DNA polymerase (family 10)
MDHLERWPGKAAVLQRGETKASIRGPREMQIDVRVVAEESFGAALQYFTGSKEHNVKLRSRARDRGLRPQQKLPPDYPAAPESGRGTGSRASRIDR